MSFRTDQEKAVFCGLCGTRMEIVPPSTARGRDYFWKCPAIGCKSTLWPYDDRQEAIYPASPGPSAKHKGGGGRGKKRGRKKLPFVPWYQRVRE